MDVVVPRAGHLAHGPDPVLVGLRLSVRLGPTMAVDGVTLDLLPGEVVALVGGNGAGKSTLLDVLAGARRPSAGRVEWPGVPDVAYVVQHSAVPVDFPITVERAVSIGCWRRLGLLRRTTADDRAKVAVALERVGMAEHANRPLGTLSGGQRQRVLVAQALVRAAEVLLLDEPTAGVDDTAAAWIRDAVADEAARGAAVLVATHDPRDVAAAHRVLTLDHGRLVDDRRR